MRKTSRRACRPHDAPRCGHSRVLRGAWLLVGLPFLGLSAVLIATSRAAGLADFMFWLCVVWIVLVRYMEAGSSAGEFLQPSRPALRKWRRFSAIMFMAGACVYALARMASSLGRT